VVVVLTGLGLIYGTFDMPGYGDPDAPIHHHMAPRFIQDTAKEIGVPNQVTAVLASYRGYDTWGETTVIFTAAIGVMLLLGVSPAVASALRQRQQGKGAREENEP
jgi:multicomponent Na+:H+ antiporter subunit B